MIRRASTMSAWTWTGIKGANNPAHEHDADNEHEDDATDTQPATKDTPAMFIPGERSRLPEPTIASAADAAASGRRDRQVLTTLALLETFHAHTTAILSRLGTLLETRKLCNPSSSSRRERIALGEGIGEGGAVLLTPKDVMSFELGPFSGLDARFVEWLGEEYGGGVRVLVRRGWKDLVGLIFGLG